MSRCDAVRAIITSRLDYANSLLYGIILHRKTQTDFNVYRPVLPSKAKKYDHTTPLLHELHWLPTRVPSRILFKLLAIVYKCFMDSTTSPSYITELIHQPYIPSRSGLRSAQDNTLLIVPHTCTLTGDKAFFVAGPFG
ncbi:uncharacterized protein [Amphiura filiformis]|uniref:uncharacterized protein n=1 Tax=Amphiura filiformis TaxID=82378 RepID=UPI003B227C92